MTHCTFIKFIIFGATALLFIIMMTVVVLATYSKSYKTRDTCGVIAPIMIPIFVAMFFLSICYPSFASEAEYYYNLTVSFNEIVDEMNSIPDGFGLNVKNLRREAYQKDLDKICSKIVNEQTHMSRKDWLAYDSIIENKRKENE